MRLHYFHPVELIVGVTHNKLDVGVGVGVDDVCVGVDVGVAVGVGIRIGERVVVCI